MCKFALLQLLIYYSKNRIEADTCAPYYVEILGHYTTGPLTKSFTSYRATSARQLTVYGRITLGQGYSFFSISLLNASYIRYKTTFDRVSPTHYYPPALSVASPTWPHVLQATRRALKRNPRRPLHRKCKAGFQHLNDRLT